MTVGSPMIPKGAIVLQVAALEKESDALEMAQVLQQRKFSAFVLPAGPDKYYRVQVGPFATVQAANAAQHDLESQGFKSIVKR
jgi:cell division septation protein DedD